MCSEKLRCDGELDHLNHISNQTGVVTQLQTSKAGARLTASTHRFVKDNPANLVNVDIEIDRSHKHQKLLGFGGSITDITGFEIGRMPLELQRRLIKDYYGPDGHEYRFTRITIGGSDYSTRLYSLDDHPKDESLSTFALQNEDFVYKMPFMKMAKEVSRHPVNFFGSAWSAPAWMKTNGELNNGGFLKDHPGGKYYKAYAHYLVRFLQEYKKNGLPMWGLTTLNEPGVFGKGHTFPYNCMGMSAEDQRGILFF